MATNNKAAVMRSMPNPNRPRLSAESEMRFADIEKRTAACYAESEELTDKLLEMAKVISGEIVNGDAIPEVVPEFDDISTVNHIEEVRKKIKTGEHEAVKK